jgi:hypothetical protein
MRRLRFFSVLLPFQPFLPMSESFRLLPSSKGRKRKHKDRLYEDDVDALDEVTVERTTIKTKKGPAEKKTYIALPGSNDPESDVKINDGDRYQDSYVYDGDRLQNYDPIPGDDVPNDTNDYAVEDDLPTSKTKAKFYSNNRNMKLT